MRNQTQRCVWAFQRPLITFRPVGGDRSVHCALTGLGQIVGAFLILKFQDFGGKTAGGTTAVWNCCDLSVCR